MRLLFEMDARDYDPGWEVFARHSARCIAIRDGHVAMVHSLKYDYYKFPGGGIEPGERPEEAMIREAREEAGLTVLPETVEEYGFVHRICRSVPDDAVTLPKRIFVQDNFYYLCRAAETLQPQQLDGYEAEEHFTLEWTEPETAIRVNREVDHGPKNRTMLEREARVLELLREEGYFD